ncbi:hypothetical protein [Clostridium perfringens]|uniref:Uncharacterized protein n=3 Tax=Clostridium perfringens TaxID=1502 RepID=A0A8H9QY91_CLOPF|nr:hypothetical protein [Clostridium perfringens]MDU7977678.1 hypothetical protein [Clostridioides difficile]EDT15789.1 hypothetical protein AC3_A0097 [Clostridium perfringens E str. JGS1987]MBI6024925.1 hypothetical protein [Clostridium perfringens]MBI6048752.1 hypothetical protein [Clostridium perfringens]MDK0554013.1 hypothetical protein [Clostridium perfringens]
MKKLKTIINNFIDALLSAINTIPRLLTIKANFLILLIVVILNLKHIENLIFMFIGLVITLYFYANYNKKIVPKVEIKTIEKEPLKFNVSYVVSNDSNSGNNTYSLYKIDYKEVSELSIRLSNQRQELDITVFDSTGNFLTCIKTEVEIGCEITDEFIINLLNQNLYLD